MLTTNLDVVTNKYWRLLLFTRLKSGLKSLNQSYKKFPKDPTSLLETSVNCTCFFTLIFMLPWLSNYWYHSHNRVAINPSSVCWWKFSTAGGINHWKDQHYWVPESHQSKDISTAVSSIYGSSHAAIDSAVIFFYTSSSDYVVILQEYVTGFHILPSKVDLICWVILTLGWWSVSFVWKPWRMATWCYRLSYYNQIADVKLFMEATIKYCHDGFGTLTPMSKSFETCFLKLNQMLQQTLTTPNFPLTCQARTTASSHCLLFKI